MDSDSKKIFLSDNETASPYLPEEILIEIFSRLPAKSVGRFRCLSKSWRTQLSTTQFIKSHLSRKPQQKNIILHEKFQRDLNIMTLHNNDITCSIKIMFDGYTELWGSCNGLVLLVTDRVGMSVFNPTTLQRVYIPDSPLALDKNEFGTIYGFGYDSYSDDYKIVILSSYKDEMYEIVKFVDVYSLKRGVWNRVISSPYGHAYYDLLPGAFVNNAIHWLNASEESGVAIVAFDLANEVFYDVCGPTDARKEVFEAFDLVVLEGCLCMFTRFRATNVFWMLNEYGSEESWTKFSMPAEILICLFELKPLCFIGDAEEKLLVVSDTKSLVVCNLKEKTCEHMDTDESEFDTGGTFVESLVSPFLIASNDRINSVMEPI